MARVQTTQSFNSCHVTPDIRLQGRNHLASTSGHIASRPDTTFAVAGEDEVALAGNSRNLLGWVRARVWLHSTEASISVRWLISQPMSYNRALARGARQTAPYACERK